MGVGHFVHAILVASILPLMANGCFSSSRTNLALHYDKAIFFPGDSRGRTNFNSFAFDENIDARVLALQSIKEERIKLGVRLEVFKEGGDNYRLVWVYRNANGGPNLIWATSDGVVRSIEGVTMKSSERDILMSLMDRTNKLRMPTVGLPKGEYYNIAGAQWYCFTTWRDYEVRQVVVHENLLDSLARWRTSLKASGFDTYFDDLKKIANDLESTASAHEQGK